MSHKLPFTKYIHLTSTDVATPLDGYNFVKCKCGSTHWVCVVPEANPPGGVGIPPVIAYVCSRCLFTLDQAPSA
jgi:hypothetical protein